MNNTLAILRSALVAFYRTSARHPLYTALNVLGLAFGIAVFIVISLYVRYELTYDRWLPGADDIYEVATAPHYASPDQPLGYDSGLYALDGVRTVIPRVKGTRLVSNFIHIKKGAQTIEEAELLVDPDMFEVFALPFVAGTHSSVLQPDGVVISETVARKYFGRTDVVGQTLTLKDLGDDYVIPSESLRQFRPFRVTAVFAAPPANSALVDAPPPFGDESLVYPGRPRHTLLQVRAVSWPGERLANPRVRGLVTGLVIVAGLALVVALLNYINLVTARGGLRAREVAVRKAVGSPLSLLRFQLLGEACLLSGTAFLLALCLVELGLPVIVAITGWGLNLDFVRDAALLTGVFAVVMTVSAVAGVYPAVVISGYGIAETLNAARFPVANRFARRLRDGLVLLQFGAVTSLLVVVLGFHVQVRHLQTSDIGFAREGWLFTQALNSDGLNEAQAETVKAAWSGVAGVDALSSGPTPGYYFRGYPYVALARAEAPGHTSQFALYLIDDRYFDTFGITLAAGRRLGKDDLMPDADLMDISHVTKTYNVVINRRGLETLDLGSTEKALGRELTYVGMRLRIVGVAPDLRMGSPKAVITPALYIISDRSRIGNDVAIRFHGDEAALVSRLTQTWHGLGMTAPIVFRPGREALDFFYREDRRLVRVFTASTAIVGLIGSVGLFGLAVFSTSARTVEIGLRKATGATRWSVVRLLLFQFLKPVLLANLLAWPVAYIILDRWLKQFDDRVPLSLWFFLAGSGMSLLVAVITVAGQVFAAAGTSPGQALRRE